MLLDRNELTITGEEFADWIIWFQQKLYRKGENPEIIKKVGEILLDFNDSLTWFNRFNEQMAVWCPECQGNCSKFLAVTKDGKPTACVKCEGQGMIRSIDLQAN